MNTPKPPPPPRSGPRQHTTDSYAGATLPELGKTLRARLLFVDDDPEFLQALKNSAHSYYSEALPLETHCTGDSNDLVGALRAFRDRNWRPDAILIDINTAQGGKTGWQYLSEIRACEEFYALPIAMMTANQFGSSAQDRIDLDQENTSEKKPSEWTRNSLDKDAEAVLYGKESSAAFLLRVAEALEQWQFSARDRVWMRLSRELSLMLKAPEVKAQAVAQQVLDFLHRHLEVSFGFSRLLGALVPNASAGQSECSLDNLQLCLAAHVHGDFASVELDTPNVPILKRLLDEKLGFKVDNISESDAGVYDGNIKGCRFLGVLLWFGSDVLGTLTLYRKPDKPVFTNKDWVFAEMVAQQLGAVFGRQRSINQHLQQQASLVEFVHEAASSHDEQSLAQTIAELLQKEINHDHPKSKATVRLLEYATGELKRHGRAGCAMDEAIVYVDNKKSIYARAVRENTNRLISNTCNEPDYLLSCHAGITSELCVPISIGKAAIGAVNLEHEHEGFYDTFNLHFVSALCRISAQFIRHLRAQRFQNELLFWANGLHRLDEKQSWDQLFGMLYSFCSHSCLLHFEPGETPNHPWKVIHVHAPGIPSPPSEEEWNAFMQQNWGESLIAKTVKSNKFDSVVYTEDKKEFVEVTSLLGHKQKADALIPLYEDNANQRPPVGIIILMWFRPPPLDAEEKMLLTLFGRVCGELVTKRRRFEQARDEWLTHEQEAALGMALQQFRHLMKNVLGGVNNQMEVLESHAAFSGAPDALAAVKRVRERVFSLEPALNRSVSYVRPPRLENMNIAAIWKQLCGDERTLAEKASRLRVEWVAEVAPTLCHADPLIVELILYTLVNNAVDALGQSNAQQKRVWAESGAEGESITFTVCDNGPGVNPDMKARLFKTGESSKKDGLGFGLSFARQRARMMGGELAYLEHPTGARFQLRLPVAQGVEK